MSALAHAPQMQPKQAPAPPKLTPVPTRLVQRKCACGGTPGPDGECAACKRKRLMRRRIESATEPTSVPPIVHEVLRAPGRPLDAATRASMEGRFSHDFRDVRVHTEPRAAASARAVGARAYTAGRDIVFGAGEYAPGAAAGRRLLAHELAHVVQQRDVRGRFAPQRLAPVDSVEEREADAAARDVLEGRPAAVGEGIRGEALVQRECGGRPLPPCPTGYVSRPSDSAIGSAVGQWIGLNYRQSQGISTYLLIDWWLYSSKGKFGTIGSRLQTTDPYVLGALQATPEWGRLFTARVDILDSDRDLVFEIKPIRGAAAGAPQLAGYLASLRALAPQAPDWMGSRPRNWQPGSWEPEPYFLVVPGGFGEICYVCTWSDPQNVGVILYDLLCCASAPPPPVYVPKEVVDKLLDHARDLLRRLGKWFDDLGPVGKVVVGVAAAIAAIALAIILLPEEIAAAIGAFLGAVLAWILEALGILGTTAAAASAGVAAFVLGAESAAAAPAPPTRQTPAPPAPGPPSGPRRPAAGKAAVQAPPPDAAVPDLAARAADALRKIQRSKSTDPRAAEVRKLARQALKIVEAYQRQAKPTGARDPGPPAPVVATPVVPGFESERKVPEQTGTTRNEYCVVEGVSPRAPAGDAVYDALIVARNPYAAFAGVAKLRVNANDGRRLVIEFAEDWWVPDVGGGAYKGRRFAQPAATIGKCGTVRLSTSTSRGPAGVQQR